MGGLKHHKVEGGQGGRRGHSNMEHWLTTAEIKAAARGLRRREAKAIIAQERSIIEETPARGAVSRPGPARSEAGLDHLASAMPEERIGRTRRIHPYQWLWEPLETDPTFVLRPMFGGKAAYLGGRLMLYFTANEEPWRGVLACTDRAHHAPLMAELPELAPHPILPKWLYLPETAGGFERTAERLVALARRRDPRLGVDPPLKKRSPRGRRAPS
jgi:hypothetical protein